MLARSLRRNYLKIVLAGDQAVGKTSIRKRYLGECFEGKYMLTIGTEFSLKKVKIDDTEMNLQIWDLAGQQQFKAVRTLYYQGATGAILVYDVTNRQTFDNLPIWIDELIMHNGNHLVPILILANKIDLREFLRTNEESITTAEGLAMTKQLEESYSQQGFKTIFSFHEVSAKSGLGVEDAINKFVTTIAQNRRVVS